MINYKIDRMFVKVFVEKPWLRKGKTEKELRGMQYRKAESLRDEIKRHCDEFEDLEIDNEGHYECSFCGYHCVDKTDYECCEDSIAEHENLLAKARELTESEEPK
jgi:hypothetical protein